LFPLFFPAASAAITLITQRCIWSQARPARILHLFLAAVSGRKSRAEHHPTEGIDAAPPRFRISEAAFVRDAACGPVLRRFYHRRAQIHVKFAAPRYDALQRSGNFNSQREKTAYVETAEGDLSR
jgi:hypothetical protein